MTRRYSALLNGQVVRRGTFDDEELLRMDFPADQGYELLLDEWLEPVLKDPTYVEQRAYAYPPLQDLADAIVHQADGNNAPMEAYIAACLAVKQQFPKP
jgi:hypothetical protein